MNMDLFQLSDDPDSGFPDPDNCKHAEGLLAYGGDLSTVRLLNAYREGIFPWYSAGTPILWWSPNPRPVFLTDTYRPNKRLLRTLNKPWGLSYDTCFESVIDACAEPRTGQPETWITPAMKRAYQALHELGYAHSVEVWWEDELVGGLYGVAIGKVFFAESKFFRRTDASKVALSKFISQLKLWGYTHLDCQVPNPHLDRLGAVSISRHDLRIAIRRGLMLASTHPAQSPGTWAQYSPSP